MSPLAFYRQMIASGVDDATAYAMAEKFEAEREAETAARYDALLDRLAVDQRAERRRAKDRLRKQGANHGIPRNSTESAEIAETLSSGSQGSLSPTPPFPPNPPNLSQEPPIVPQIEDETARKPRSKPPRGAFERFWADYPLKVGKGKADPAYCRAWRRCETDDPEGEIIAGLRRCKPLWEPEFIPHPTTWLNRDGWLDQLEPEAIDGGTGPPKFDVAAHEAWRRSVAEQFAEEPA